MELCNGSMDQLFLPQYRNNLFDKLLNRNLSSDKVLLQLAEGLEYIHSKKIVHRDIKPANVLIKYTELQYEDKVLFKWADFGLSKLVSEEGHFSISTTGREVGTTFWIAPEILMGNSSRNTSESASSCDDDTNNLNLSIKCDIWSAGCVFYYYLTQGKHPFGDWNNRDKITWNVKEGNPVNIAERKDI